MRALGGEALRRLAPRTVEGPGTLDRETHAPIPGGLFDEAIFAGGAFGRIDLACAVRHPLAPDRELTALAVLPPSLRPIARRDGEWVMSDLNRHYQEILVRNGRLRRLATIAAPATIIDGERVALARAVEGLMHNERLEPPLRDDAGRVLASLSALPPDAAVLQAMGFDPVPSSSD